MVFVPTALPMKGVAYAQEASSTVKKICEWRVTTELTPDCFEGDVMLINEFMPTLEVVQGDMVEITVVNDILDSFHTAKQGISMHWHGFRMKDAPWYDGAAFVNQCPILKGSRWTYRFVVNEFPGTYFW